MRKTFTERERDQFLENAFEYMARFFENSLNEALRRATPKMRERSNGSTQPIAAVYKEPVRLFSMQIRLGGALGKRNFVPHGANENPINEIYQSR